MITWTKFQIVISKHFWDWNASWGGSENYTWPEDHAMRVQEGPCLHVVANSNSYLSQQDLSSIYLYILSKMELLRTVCLYKDRFSVAIMKEQKNKKETPLLFWKHQRNNKFLNFFNYSFPLARAWKTPVKTFKTNNTSFMWLKIN